MTKYESIGSPDNYFRTTSLHYAFSNIPLNRQFNYDLTDLGTGDNDETLLTMVKKHMAEKNCIASIGNAMILTKEIFSHWREGRKINNFNMDKYRGYAYPGWTQVRNGTVDYLYTVDLKLAGYTYFFERTWSFSPPDLPVDLYTLDPRIDRHIAQQNLNIIGQGQSMTFQLIHLPLTDEHIALIPLVRDQMMMTRHPMLANFKIKVTESAQDVQLERRRGGFTFQSRGDGPGLTEQAATSKDLEAALLTIAKSCGNRKSIQAARRAYREMNRLMQ